MKTLRYLLIFAVLLICISGTSAQQQSHESALKVVTLHKKPLSKRPNAPSRNSIVCSYSKGYIELIFPENIDQVYIQLKQSDDILWHGFLSSLTPFSIIPDLSGEFMLECEDTDGSIYIGELFFD